MVTELRQKSQITIPSEFVKKFSLVPGDKFEVFEQDGMICFMPVAVYPKKYVEDFDEGLQYFQAKGYVTEDKVKKYGQGIPYVNLVKGANRITLSSSVGSM